MFFVLNYTLNSDLIYLTFFPNHFPCVWQWEKLKAHQKATWNSFAQPRVLLAFSDLQEDKPQPGTKRKDKWKKKYRGQRVGETSWVGGAQSIKLLTPLWPVMCPYHSKNAQWRNVNNVTEGTIKLPIKGCRSTVLPVNYSPQALIRTGGGRGADKGVEIATKGGMRLGSGRGSVAREGWEGLKKIVFRCPIRLLRNNEGESDRWVWKLDQDDNNNNKKLYWKTDSMAAISGMGGALPRLGNHSWLAMSHRFSSNATKQRPNKRSLDFLSLRHRSLKSHHWVMIWGGAAWRCNARHTGSKCKHSSDGWNESRRWSNSRECKQSREHDPQRS